jgi:hypothetical protein
MIPFPLWRRRDFVCRHAQIINELPPGSAELHIAQQLDIKRKALRRRGITDDRIEREIALLDRAIRLTAMECVA